ncbi:PHD-finger domain-containing protein [Babesia caballi]|uniref:PHD-finger domain-containing protein n=1 Tax=Babesia caballi TaxID=5871 RepID=A0AAV4LML4_BABCB|nr:PHD-finger domain-containing protein [Babesia caballi]
MDGTRSAPPADGGADMAAVSEGAAAAPAAPPTDYISALAHYGNLKSSAEFSRLDSQLRSSFGNDVVFCESLSLGHSLFESTLYHGFDPGLWPVEADILDRGGRNFSSLLPVVIAEEERCDACLGSLGGDDYSCSVCGVRVHEFCYFPKGAKPKPKKRVTPEQPCEEPQPTTLPLSPSDSSDPPQDNAAEEPGHMPTANEEIVNSDDPPDTDALKCDVCSAASQEPPPTCPLCGLSGGAMRQLPTDGLWVHCSCVTFAPPTSGVAFEIPLRMQHPQGVEEYLKKPKGKEKCDACGRDEGLIVPCSYQKCCRHLHARCALFNDKYGGTAFSEHIYYRLDERRQYFGFLGVFCLEHSSHEFVTLAVQMTLRRRQVIRERDSSSYRKYQMEAADVVRMSTAVTAAAYNDDDDDEQSSEAFPELVFQVEPDIAVPLQPDAAKEGEAAEVQPRGRRNIIKEWIEYLKGGQEATPRRAHIVPLQKPDNDAIELNIPADAVAPADEPPIVEVQTAQPEAALEGIGSQFRSQRMMWQKFDIFRPIPYGPAADRLLQNLDPASRKKSVAEYARLESDVLACNDFLEARDMSEMSLQQILHGCRGVLELLELLKTEVDRELQVSSSKASSSMLTNNQRKHTRIHVLVDTGRTAGMLIFRINKWLLDVLHDDADLAERNDKVAMSAAGAALDEEVRHFLSHVQSEVVRNTYSTVGFHSSGAGGVKEVDLLSGVSEYGLKDDLRQLHVAVNAVSSDGEILRMRRKLLKRSKGDPSLKSVQLEKFVVLTPLESELLRRSTLELSYATDSNVKLAVLNHTVQASPEVSCLQMIDWANVVNRIKSASRHSGNKAGSKASSSRATQPSSPSTTSATNGTTGTTAGSVTGRAASTTAAATTPAKGNDPPHTLPPVPMVYLGKQTWPVVDDVNFVRRQKEITECDLSVVSSQLRKIRENIRENVLGANSLQPTMNERLGCAAELLDQYEAMERWTTLVMNVSKGMCDSADSITPTSTTHHLQGPPVPLVVTPSPSDTRNAAKRAEGMAEGAYCSVCFVNTGNNLNPIYTCSRCYMSAHRNCYGIGRAGKEVEPSDYLCRRCEYERRTMGSQWQTAFRSCSLLCSICGRGGGALKRCDVDEWAHVFCLVVLMPETHCSNYSSLEPWTLQGLARWRREAVCSVCRVAWGHVTRCSDCDVTVHPLCAWLHGFRFSPSSSMGYVSYLTHGNVLMRQLLVRVHCNAHDGSRQWQLFVSARNKRFLNRDTAASMFEGREKRRKSRPLLLEAAASSESLETTSAANEVSEPTATPTVPPVDRRCGVCFGVGHLAECEQCRAQVHYSCYVEHEVQPAKGKRADATGAVDSFICDVCRNGDESAACALCQVAAGVLKQVTGLHAAGDQQVHYIHTICGVCFPEALVEIYGGAPPTGSPEPLGGDCVEALAWAGAAPCACCHSASGLMVRCCQEGCDVCFHPSCGMENRYVVESYCLDVTVGPQHVAFCQQHSLLPRSVGANLKLMLRLRPYLQLLQQVVGDMAAQDTVMRAWYRKRQELLNAECPLGSLIKKREEQS